MINGTEYRQAREEWNEMVGKDRRGAVTESGWN